MLSGNVKQPEGEHILLGQLAGIDKKSRLQANTNTNANATSNHNLNISGASVCLGAHCPI